MGIKLNHISMFVVGGFSAFLIAACGVTDSSPSSGAPTPTPQAVTAVPATPIPTGVRGDPESLRPEWQATLATLEPDAVCQNLSRQGLEPYESLIDFTSEPDTLIESGWSYRGRQAFRLEPPIDWEHLVSVDRSWNFHLNAWGPLNPILIEYTRTSQPRYLSFAVALAGDWILENPYTTHEAVTDVEDFGWYDMAVGLRVHALAFILDAACREPSVSVAQVGRLWESLLEHFEYLSDDDNIAFLNNHGLYQAAGQFAAATRFSGFEVISQFRVQAVNRLVQMIDQQFSSEGVHLEHSPGYHRLVMDVVTDVSSLGLLAESPSLAARIEWFEDALAWMILPNRRLANLGDTDYHKLSEEKFLGIQSPLLRYALSGGLEGSATAQRIGIFPESGLAVLRSGWPDASHFDQASYLAQQAGFHSRTHKQADDLSFIWYDRGTEILIDAGRYGYLGRTEAGSDLWNRGFWYSDPKRIYVESTRSHNTVEIDGMSYDRRESIPYGSAIKRWGENSDGLMFVETHAPQFQSIGHSRLLVLNPKNWLLVYDRLWDDAQDDHDFRQWFHFAPDLTVESGKGMLHVSGEPLDTDLTVVSLLPSAAPSAPVFGQEYPDLLGWWSERGGVFEPTTSVDFSINGAPSAVFATLFSFSDGVTPDLDYQEVDASGRNAKFRWSTTGQQHTLSFARPAEGDLSVDYEVEPVH